ncbi:leucine-rich repeat domain-containing protein [Candidatus Saccharibacteria bacterium]|nr:MAG: leucine-rich repeat domain-containing protein [Candidatus Saccharibacteria bacterium]
MSKKIFAGLMMVIVFTGFIFYVLSKKDNEQPNITSTTTASKGELNKAGQNLSQVSSEIYNQTDTMVLVFSNNSLKSLPSEMGRMVNLTTLKLDHNQLEGSLIGEIRQMQNLKILDASYNKMTGIPAEIGQLKNLQSLDYSYNQITDLPNELANLKNLKLLNLTANPISTDKIQSLKAALPKTNIIF